MGRLFGQSEGMNPEIILTAPLPDLHPHDIGWVRSIMLFPDDENLRKQNYAVEVAKYEVSSSDASRTLSTECIKLLIEAPSDSALQRIRNESTKEGFVAGAILTAMYLMHHYKLAEPSINKAIFVAKEFSKKTAYGDGSPTPAETKIKEYWRQYAPVAHLWAAFELNRLYPIVESEADCLSETGFPKFLQLAASVYNFGITFIPKRARPQTPILNKSETWAIDKQIEPLVLQESTPPPELLKILKKYKAPVGNY